MQDDRTREVDAIGRAVAASRERAATAVGVVLRHGMEAYDRAAMLPRLIPVGPDEIADDGRRGRITILARLARALRGERARGRAGHWSYSLDRHLALAQALAAERRRFLDAIGRPVGGAEAALLRAPLPGRTDRPPG